MKYVVLLGDGMSDEKIPALGGKTPLQQADTPHMDQLAQQGELGYVETTPAGFMPGSDVANMILLGYDVHRYYSGRSSLEACGLGLNVKESDLILRCNLVSLSAEKVFEDKKMMDYSAGGIDSQAAAALVAALNKHFAGSPLRFFPGKGFRQILLWREGKNQQILVPPHDIWQEKIGNHLPQGFLRDVMREGASFLDKFKLNQQRKEKGEMPANGIWLWGAGSKLKLPAFQEMHGYKGAMVSAVDLMKGLAKASGMTFLPVQGATGLLETNYRGKAEMALRHLDAGHDFVYIHVEAPDDVSHLGLVGPKVTAIEKIDQELLGTLLSGLKKRGEDHRLLVLPDHPTLIRSKTHSNEPVPYLLFDSRQKLSLQDVQGYDEFEAASSGIRIKDGTLVIKRLFEEE